MAFFYIKKNSAWNSTFHNSSEMQQKKKKKKNYNELDSWKIDFLVNM